MKIHILIISFLFLFSGCGEQVHKIRIGYVPIAVGLPLFVANDEGYFRDQGYETEMTRLSSSNELANAVTSGQIDVAVVATNVMLDIGYVSKKKHTLVVTNPYSNISGHITDYLIVKDSTKIKDIRDLKGKKVAVFPGSVIKVFCTLIFQEYGLNEGDYQLVELAPKDWAVALQTDQVDAISALEPQASQIIQDKIGIPIVNGLYSKLMPEVPLSAQWISEDFVKANGPIATKKIIAAIDKAVDFINANPDAAKRYLVKYANVREDVIGRVQLNPWRKHDQQDPKTIQQFFDILYQHKAIQHKESIDDYLHIGL